MDGMYCTKPIRDGVGLYSSRANSVFTSRSLGFKHVTRQLQGRFEDRYLLIYSGDSIMSSSKGAP